MIDSDRIAAIEARCEAATPGPWMIKIHNLEVAYNDDFYNCAVYINFCPMCGKRLEVEK